MVSSDAQEAANSAGEVISEVRSLIASAKRTRGGGWSLENLLDAQFMMQSASLLIQAELMEQNVRIIGLLEQSDASDQVR